RVLPPLPPGALAPLPLLDLSGLGVLDGLGGARAEEAARGLAAAEAARPFDLARGPLWRAALLRLAPRRHVLMLTLHHAAADGWSLEILVRELSALYAAFAERRAPELPPLPLQYADYALWQRAWLDAEVLGGLLAAARERLAGAPLL